MEKVKCIDYGFVNSTKVVEAICDKEGYTYLGPLKDIDIGKQATLYSISKNGVEYVLKHYVTWAAGRPGEGFRKSDGTFNEKEYNKKIERVSKHIEIEETLAKSTMLRECKNILNVVVAGSITFTDGASKLTEYFSIMEKYSPLDLDGEIRSEKEVLKLGVDICNALIVLNKCGHEFKEKGEKTGKRKGVLHSDIKYPNILYSERNNCYVLCDFGAAKLKGLETSDSSVPWGSDLYMAPEAAKGKYSTKADLYSLCATLYLLVNEGSFSSAAPQARVGSDRAKRKHILFTGTMPAPQNASYELKQLLVNQLEYDSKNRRCKSAEELKTALQRIQLNHAIIAHRNSNIELCSSYIGDINSRGIENPSLLADIGELLLSKSKYKEARVYIEKACEMKDSKGLYLDGIMWRDGKGHQKHENNAKVRFSQAINNSSNSSDIKWQAKEALRELEDNGEEKRKKIEATEQKFPKRRIATLIFMCGIIVLTMGGLLMLPMFKDGNGIHIISGVASIADALILALCCKILLKESVYASIAVDLIIVFTCMHLHADLCSIMELEVLVIWKVLLMLFCVLAIVIIALCVLIICEDFYISPIKITNFLVCGATFLASIIVVIMGYKGTELIGLDQTTENIVLCLGYSLSVACVALVALKLIDGKAISQGFNRKSENRYTLISILLVVVIIISVYISVDIIPDIIGIIALLVTYIAGMIWINRNVVEKRDQKCIWMISFLSIVLFVELVQFSYLFSNIIVGFLGPYIENSELFCKISLQEYQVVIAVIIAFLVNRFWKISLFSAYGVISNTFHRTNILAADKVAPKILEAVLPLIGAGAVVYIITVIFKDGVLAYIDLIIIGCTTGGFLIYLFIYNYIICKIMNQNTCEYTGIMALKRLDVITFEDDEKVVVLDEIVYNGNKYIYVQGVHPDESDVFDWYKVMRIYAEDETLQKVVDVELLKTILPKFKLNNKYKKVEKVI